VNDAAWREARERFEDEAVSAERSFAIRAAYDGIRAAFLAVLAEDALILGEGPEPGRSAYEALPKDFPGRLMWDPAVVAASADGTLAFTSGPYRFLDHAGQEKSRGVYFSVWRRHLESGHLELVLDFGAKGAEFPALDGELRRLTGTPDSGGRSDLAAFLGACLKEGRWPKPEGALLLGADLGETGDRPTGLHASRDGELGVLWGSRRRADGSTGATTVVVRSGHPEPVALAWINA